MTPSRFRNLTLILLSAAATAVILIFFPTRPTPPALPAGAMIQFTGQTMGGGWSVKIPRLPAGIDPETLESRLSNELARLDQMLSLWREDSNVSRFNRQTSTQWQSVPPELASIVETAKQISEQTGGAFDITIAPLVNLWGFGPAQSGGRLNAIPTDDLIAAARRRVDYRRVESRLDPPALRKLQPDVEMDLGAIGKGFAADAAARVLDSAGVEHYLIAIGGELRARGQSAAGRPWRVGIETPAADMNRVLLTVELSNAGVSTSGDYRNFFDINGQRFCHEIDPRTGRPINQARGPAMVSVIHASSTHADALATALFVLGPDEGYAAARRLGIAALFVTRAGDHFETKMTPEFEAAVVRVGTVAR